MDILGQISNRQKYRIYIRLAVIVLAGGAAYLFALWMQQQHYVRALWPGFALVVLSIVEFAAADILLDRRFPSASSHFLERLQNRLRSTTIHEEILRTLQLCVADFRGCDRSRISSTVHLRVEVLSEYGAEALPALVQLSDYTRAGLGGRRWRLLAQTKGLVGQCLRLEQTVWVNFRDATDYQVRMVRDFGFTSAEVTRHTTTARSYFAAPLKNDGEVVGVIYFFSTEPQVFPYAAPVVSVQRAADNVVSLLRAADVL